MPASGRPCRYCGDPIVWGQSAGRPIPKNPDGSDHRCRAASKPAKPTVKQTGRTVGENYYKIEHRHDCQAAPWEDCDCAKKADAA